MEKYNWGFERDPDPVFSDAKSDNCVSRTPESENVPGSPRVQNSQIHHHQEHIWPQQVKENADLISEIQASDDALGFMGERVPENTTRKNRPSWEDFIGLL